VDVQSIGSVRQFPGHDLDVWVNLVPSGDTLAGLGLAGGLGSDENHPDSTQRGFLWERSEKYNDCTASPGSEK